MDHALSMIVPWIGGFIWTRLGYEYVFLGGAVIVVMNLLTTRRIRIEKPLTVTEEIG